MKTAEFKRLRNIKVKNRKKLMSLPNVNGVGIGPKMVNGEATERPALRVYVTKKVPVERLKKDERIPGRIGGFITDVVQIGEVHFLTHMTRERPARGGDSISDCRPTYISAGTLGGVFTDNTDGATVILSNNHVIGGFDDETINYAAVGDKVVQPGTYDWGSCTDDVIALLKRWVPYKLVPAWNKVDAAMAGVINNADVVNDIHDVGPPTGVRALTTGDENVTVVQKSGRTTQYTQGTVVDIAYDTSPMTTIHGNDAQFEDQILVAPIGGVPVSDHGDSGALVLDMDAKIVGLLFAGSSSGYMMANHISDVLDALDIRFPSWHIPVCMKELVLECRWLHFNCLKMVIPGTDYCPAINPIPFIPWEVFGRDPVYADPKRMPPAVRRAFEKMMGEMRKRRAR